MKNYRLINNVTGWFVFAVAAITYFLTIEPTASFWDCGEFITSAYKLEVGHPPGAPFFMILGRFFTLFSFGDVSQVALMVNIMSALASAFTILFLFWSITHIAKRIIAKTEELTKGQSIAIFASGIVGALVFTFSDSFWFSAVEGEVYATSSLFTAVVFWAILKWEAEADQAYANRWLILIAYLMGLSIGVHLLNLLAIPAIVYIYYFKKYETTPKGIFYAAIVSVLMLAVIMYGIVQGIFVLGSKFELLFVNSFGLPFVSGLLFYFALLFAGIIFGIYHTYKHNKPVWNTVFTMLAVILIGYSSFALILVRSKADTPMNQNKPDDVFSLLGYLNREQYGERPLMFGQYFNSQLDEDEPYPVVGPVRFDKKDENGKDYYKTIDQKRKRSFRSEDITFFPRMYSDQDSPDHIQGYINWLEKSEDEFYYPQVNPETNQPVRNRYGEIQYDYYRPKRIPTFGENLQYFFGYQLNYMYFRYFMWNFAGRQNDTQGQGKCDSGGPNVKDGNWISGIKFIDEWRLGNQDKITPSMKNNKGRNVYYFLPLLLGILGMVFMYKQGKKGKQYFWVVMLFFFFTGIAIVLYLNQPPFQPRERDYAYAGSFYVFAMYIGFGVAFLYNLLKKYIPETTGAIIAGIAALGVPILMAQQNWDDHNRSNRYTATDYAKNYLDSCDENAIIFTNGDNDTFPLWYVQEVEGYRTDVRVINLSYFNTEWYIDQMRKQAYLSPPIKFTLKPEQYEPGQRDIVYVMENPNIYLQERYRAKKAYFDLTYAPLYGEYFQMLSNSGFKSAFAKDYEHLAEGYEKTDPVQLYSLGKQLEKLNDEKNVGIPKDKLTELNSSLQKLVVQISESSLPLQTVINHVAQEDKKYKAPLQSGEYVNYLPTQKFLIPVNKAKVIENGIVHKSDENKVLNAVEWNFNQQHLTKNQLLLLDMLATQNWDRPIYFATTVGNSLYMNLEDYFQLEGLAYKVVPIRNTQQMLGSEGRVNTDILFDRLMNKFKWGGLDKNADKIYMDENNRRFVMNFKSSFLALAQQLVKEKKFDKAEAVLDKCFQLFTNDLADYTYYDLMLSNLYFDIQKDEKALNIFKITLDNLHAELEYYMSLDEKYLKGIQDEVGRNSAIYQDALSKLFSAKQNDFANEYALKAYNLIEEKFAFNSKVQNLTSMEAQQNWFSNMPDYEMGLFQLQMYIAENMSE